MSYANEATPADLASLTKRRGNKYGAVPAYYNGERYDSGAEASYAASLDMRRRAGEIDCWQRQVPVVLHGARGGKVRTWKIDFLVTFPDARQIYVEVKGFKTREFRLMEKLFRQQYPDETLLVVPA